MRVGKYLIPGLLLFVVLSSFRIDAQPSEEPDSTARRYVAWYSPAKATHVYGVMLNVFPKNGLSPAGEVQYPRIYGTELNLNPLGFFAAPIFAIHCLDPRSWEHAEKSVDSINFDAFKKIHGLQIGVINMEPSIINGIDININGSMDSKTNGLIISAIVNKQYVSNGLTIGTLGNHNIECRGVQIGLFNTARKMRGFQFGLWNRNEKRSLPLINWNFN